MQLLDALELSRLTMKTVKQNLWWAFAYNIVSFFLFFFAAKHSCFFSYFFLINSVKLQALKRDVHIPFLGVFCPR
jgi:cation transport ATPase